MAARAFDIGQDRYGRHVRRARLCVDAQAPAHRLAFTVEEALRLAALPGENEGRSYYFRHLRVTGLPPNGDRGAWLEKFQRALEQQAAQAVHGGDPRAALAAAVYFHGEQEALEILLHRVLARRTASEWFWPMVIGEWAVSAGGGSIVDIVEKLRDRPASWVAVAAALFAAPKFDVVRLLEAIPAGVAEGWLREMDGPPLLSIGAGPRFAQRALPAMQQALRVFGFTSARVLWLATVAILFDSPAEMAAGTAVWRARQALGRIAAGAAAEPEASRARQGSERIAEAAAETGASRARKGWEPIAAGAAGGAEAAAETGARRARQDLERTAEGASGDAARPDDRRQAGHAETADEPVVIAQRATEGDENPADHKKRWSAPREAFDGAISAEPASESDGVVAGSPFSAAAPIAPAPQPSADPWYCSGLPTHAGGFFFLLNALRRVGVAEALAAGLGRAGPDFVVRVLRSLAAHSGVTEDDPILVWLNSLTTGPGGDDPLPCDASCWPLNLKSARDTAPLDYIVRVWYLGVRRWCWRAAKIGVREIATRPGVFSVNRTDLDVSLPLDRADMRVRRAGLDLDPGWLPWFGRVVRFHYLFRGEFHA